MSSTTTTPTTKTPIMTIEQAIEVAQLTPAYYAGHQREIAENLQRPLDGCFADYVQLIRHDADSWIASFPQKLASATAHPRPKHSMLKILQNEQVRQVLGKELCTDAIAAIELAWKAHWDTWHQRQTPKNAPLEEAATGAEDPLRSSDQLVIQPTVERVVIGGATLPSEAHPADQARKDAELVEVAVAAAAAVAAPPAPAVIAADRDVQKLLANIATLKLYVRMLVRELHPTYNFTHALLEQLLSTM